MRTIHIAITAQITGPAQRMTPRAIESLVLKLLAIGQADAHDTIRQGEGSMRDAERAVAIDFRSVTVSEG